MLSPVPALARTYLSSIRTLHLLLLFAAVVAAPAAVAGEPPPATNGSATQAVTLEAGWNWIGLHVYPESSSIEDVLSSILDQVLLVKDGAGRAYMPAFGVTDLAEWQWNNGYMVKVSSPVTLTVAGALIAMAGSAISLEAGWRLVPFLGDEPLPVEEAFASLGGSLVMARDAAGLTYAPGDDASALSMLEPGTAYQILLETPATLVYGWSAGTAVATRSQLMAIPTADLPLGETVFASGYYQAGDGGGGVFMLADEPDFGCDGAIVICPNDQLGSVATEQTTFNSSQGRKTHQLAHRPSLGTLILSLSATNAGGEPWSLDIPDSYMHGVVHQGRDGWSPSLNPATGRFHDFWQGGGAPFNIFAGAHLGSSWSMDAVFTYRPVEGDRRWIRIGDAAGEPLPETQQVWDARWFGCRAHAEAAYFDNTNCINWAMLTAKYTNQAFPERVAEIRLSRNGAPAATFYYLKSIQVADGLTLAGDAGAEVVTATDEFGNDFHPVRRRADAVTLKVLPEAADGCTACSHVFDHVDMRRPFGDPHHLPPSAPALFGNSATAIHPEDAAGTWTVRDLVIDGNLDEQDIYADRFSSSDREHQLRNSPGYAGIAQTNHRGKDIHNQRLTIERSFVTGFGASGILTGNLADTTFIRDVSTGNIGYNHAGYFVGAVDAVNLSVHGKAWGYLEIYGGRFTNIVIDQLASGRTAPAIINWRGSDRDRVEDCPGTHPCGTVVNGIYLDLEGSNRHYSLAGIGPGIHINDVRIITRSDEASAGLWRENGNGWQSARYHDVRIENVQYFIRSSASSQYILANHYFAESSFRNIQVKHEGDINRDWGSCVRIRTSSRGHDTTPPYEIIYDAFGSADAPLRCERPARAGFNSSTEPHRFFILNSYFANTDHGVIRGTSGAVPGTGRIASVCQDDEPCDRTKFGQVFLENVELQARENRFRDGELFFEIARFRNVTDPVTGATSEDGGSFTCDGSTTYEVPTNLFWRPHATRGRFDLAGGPAVASIDYVNADGATVGPSYLELDERDARQPFARITFEGACANGTTVEWDAAVSEWLDENGQPVAVPEWYPH